MDYQYSNRNPLGLLENDCVPRAVSCATGRSWDRVYDELSDLAQAKGTLLDDREFVISYLDDHYERVPYLPYTVREVAEMYQDNVVLCTMRGHITCIKYGIVYDTFDPSRRIVEEAWIVR